MNSRPAIRFATWNVNSVRKRVGQIVQWMSDSGIDVLCLQETKCVNEQFPLDPFTEIGYECHVYGQKAYNGVAIISRLKATNIVYGIPGYNDPECRVIAASICRIRTLSVYVPNGQQVGAEKFVYKMEWLGKFERYLADIAKTHEMALVGGDYNIAPEDIDVHDPAAWGDEVPASPPEREAYGKLLATGYADLFRTLHPEEQMFSWWDYRQNSFARNRGLRIDIALATPKTVANTTECLIDDRPRGNESPSDHAPVVTEIISG